MSSEARACRNCSQNFVIESEDADFYKKMQVPPPTFCYLCRAQRRFAFRNDRPLFKRKSDLSGQDIFATYPQSVVFPVYSQEEWFSDKWDALDYGKDYDFSRPFFEQFKELSDGVPKPAKSSNGFFINSDYSNNCNDLKNCYLIFNASYDENCAYGNGITHSSYCFDNSNVNYFELSYENFNSARCSRAFFSMMTVDCVDVYFSKDLRGCHDCFGCTNLRKKSYYIWNQPYSKEDYFKELKKYDLGSYAALKEIRAKAEKFWLEFPNKFREDGSKSVNVSGEYVYQSKNAHKVYQAIGAEDVKYSQYVNYPPIKDCQDFTVYGENTQHCYECAMVGDEAYNLKFCLQTYSNVRDMEYCEYCTSTSSLFGCVSLRNKKYCVLNKQYSESAYKELIPKIKKHMDDMPYVDATGREYRYGEFFPPMFSAFGYNETIAQEHFPLAKEEALKQKYHWQTIESSHHTVTKKPGDLPDHIKETDEQVLKEIIGCEHQGACDHGCTDALRILPEEFQFYKRFNIALPRLCVNCRHRERIKKRNSVKLWSRQCMCDYAVYKNISNHAHHPEGRCSNEFETSYAPERPEIVYCRPCYQTEVA